jgi:uncharacterized protein (DUF2235 family)
VAKNILIFSDGTGQAGGQRPDQRLSNIYKLYRATRIGPDNKINPDEQVAFYDAGLGTAEFGGPWWTTPITTVRKLFSSATGGGISLNMVDCYEAILRNYAKGDRIYLFGFSRGGYTARSLANAIALCGIPAAGPNGAPLPRAGKALRSIAEEAIYKVYDHGAGRKHQAYIEQQNELARRFRHKYGSEDVNRSDKANVAPYFIGVFDSVAALGMSTGIRAFAVIISMLAMAGAAALIAWPLRGLFGFSFGWAWTAVFALAVCWATHRFIRNQLKYIADFPGSLWSRFHFSIWRLKREEADTRLDPDVSFARHALAIDERRYSFGRAVWGSTTADTMGSTPGVPRFVQLWFAGNHSDIGGSYPENESRLSDIPLSWMVKQATNLPHPILIDSDKLQLFPRADGMQHCEVESVLNRYPAWWPKRFRLSWKTDLRASASGATHHPSVKDRFQLAAVQQYDRMAPYRPAALIYHRPYAHECQTSNAHCLPANFEETWIKVQAGWAEDDAATEGRQQ